MRSTSGTVLGYLGPLNSFGEYQLVTTASAAFTVNVYTDTPGPSDIPAVRAPSTLIAGAFADPLRLLVWSVPRPRRHHRLRQHEQQPPPGFVQLRLHHKCRPVACVLARGHRAEQLLVRDRRARSLRERDLAVRRGESCNHAAVDQYGWK